MQQEGTSIVLLAAVHLIDKSLQKIRTQKREIDRLRDALAAFAKHDCSSDEDDAMSIDSDGEHTTYGTTGLAALYGETDEDEEDELYDDESEELPEHKVGTNPIHDKSDDVHRCSKCAWEIVSGFCHSCDLQYAIPPVSPPIHQVALRTD